jgi:methylenetetrahydrofolate dehydrogenase (NADP+) / methenyltetrahydrofolate cyclohydrolase
VTRIDGTAIAAELRAATTDAVAALRERGITPRLAQVVPTDDEGTAWYVRTLTKAAERVGIESQVEQLADPEPGDISARLAALSAEPAVHGILCQTPLPAGLSLDEVGEHIAPGKDVDGANPASAGRLAAGLPTYAPATAEAVLHILRHEQVRLEGARAVVIGRSMVVGKPTALLLLGAHATVTVCHSRTRDLAAVCAEADVLVAAIGRPRFVTADFVKPGAVVIDVGTNPTEDGSLVGDVDYGSVEATATITPVPGGVGPVTTQLLLRHVALAASGKLGG